MKTFGGLIILAASVVGVSALYFGDFWTALAMLITVVSVSISVRSM